MNNWSVENDLREGRYDHITHLVNFSFFFFFFFFLFLFVKGYCSDCKKKI